MSDGGKGSARRPLSVSIDKFDQSFDMIFKKKDQCGLCKKDKATCGCMPTDDGPGQENADNQTAHKNDQQEGE